MITPYIFADKIHPDRCNLLLAWCVTFGKLGIDWMPNILNMFFVKENWN